MTIMLFIVIITINNYNIMNDNDNNNERLPDPARIRRAPQDDQSGRRRYQGPAFT